MTFDAHVNHLSRKVLSTIVYINRITGDFNINSRHCYPVTRSKHNLFRYKDLGDSEYETPTINTKATKLLRKLHKAVEQKRGRATLFIKELGWLKIQEKYKYEQGLMMHNIIQENVPNYLFSMISVRHVRTTPDSRTTCVSPTGTKILRQDPSS